MSFLHNGSGFACLQLHSMLSGRACLFLLPATWYYASDCISVRLLVSSIPQLQSSPAVEEHVACSVVYTGQCGLPEARCMVSAGLTHLCCLQMNLLDRAVKLAAEQDEPEEMNFVRRHARQQVLCPIQPCNACTAVL